MSIIEHNIKNFTRKYNKYLQTKECHMKKKKAGFFNIITESFFDITGIMLVALDRKGNIRRINEKGCEILEYSKNEIIGRNWFKHFLPKPYSDKIDKMYAQLIAEKIELVEYYENPVLTKSNRERVIKWNNTILRDDDGKIMGILSSGEDITDRKRVEKALRKSKERLDLALAVSNDGVWDWDLTNDHVYFDTRYYKMAGYDPNEFPNRLKEFQKRVHPKDIAEVMNQAEKHLNGKIDKFKVEFRFKRKDGEWMWMQGSGKIVEKDENGKPLRFVGTHRNITDRKSAEKELQKSEKKYRTFFKTVRDCVFITSKEGDWLDLNDAAVELFGYNNKEELSKVKISDLYLNAEDRKHHIELIEKKGYVKNNPIDLMKKDGSIIHSLITTVPIKDDQGEVIAYQGTIRDITERKKAVKALRESEERFRKSIMEAPFPAMVHAEDGEVILINKMWETISGYQLKEIPTISDWTKKGYGERKNKVKEDIDKLYSLNKKIDEGEYTIKTKQGRDVVWHFSSSPLGRDEKKRRLVLSMAHDVTKQKETELKQKQILREINFINDTIIKTSRMQNIDSICNYIGEVIHKVNPGSYVAVTLYDPEIDAVRIRSLVGFDKYIDRLSRMAGKDPTQFSFHPEEMEEMANLYTTGKLEHMMKGLYTLMEGKVPKIVCQTAERLLGIENIYTVGFALEKKPYGGIIILTAKGQDINYSSAIEAITSHVSEILQRRQTELALKESEERYNALYDRSLDLVFIYDFQGNLLDVNTATLNLFGYSEEEIKNLDFNSLLSNEEQMLKAQKTLDELVVSGHQQDVTQLQLRTKKGEILWVETKSSIIYKEGKRYAVLGVGRNITERKRAEQQLEKNLHEKEILLKEIHHRVKNNLNVIVSLLNLQSNQIKNKDQALSAFHEIKDRIYSIALVHDQLYQTNNFSRINMKNYIESMSNSLLSSLSRGKKITLHISIKDIYLDINKAVPCGLILNEIVTNSLKHAFPKKNKGKILIQFCRENNQYKFLVKDDGHGIMDNIDVNNTKTLGLRLIHLLTKQISGTLEIISKNGTLFRVVFPADDEVTKD